MATKSPPKTCLLINPPRYEVIPNYYDKELFCRIWATYAQPAGLLRIGSYLRNKNYKVSLINCGNSAVDMLTPCHVIGKRKTGNFKDGDIFSPLYHFGMPFDNFKAKMAQQSPPDEIYITSFFTYQWEPIHRIIKICKSFFPLSKIILGGTYPTLCPEHAIKCGADFIWSGEFKKTNHCHVALDLLEEKPDYIVIKSSRGCLNKCSYCAVPVLEGHSMRYRTPEDTVNEIEEKKRKFNIKRVVFWESNILLNSKNHIECILDLMLKKKLKLSVSFPEGLDPWLLTEVILNKMKDAGVECLELSIETCNAWTAQKRFKSHDKFSAFQKKLTLIKRTKFPKPNRAFVLAGLPGQDFEEIKITAKAISDSGFYPLIMPFTPIPKTYEYDACFSAIKSKGLEELHPMLWPCVNDRASYDKLCDLHKKLLNIAKNFFDDNIDAGNFSEKFIH